MMTTVNLRKKPVAFKLSPWILTALDIVRNDQPSKVSRTKIMEKMLAKELSKLGLKEDHPRIVAALQAELRTKNPTIRMKKVFR